jgi:DNA mismatch endonuclease (patch repair protein)
LTDVLSPERRSWNMSRIRGSDTRPEMQVRSALHRAGFRFRLHRKDLPGRPDIVLPKYKTVVFVHGCFWHRHPRCRWAYEPKSRTVFWNEKFRRNVERDRRNASELRRLGWRVVTVWECEAAAPATWINRILRLIARSAPAQTDPG